LKTPLFFILPVLFLLYFTENAHSDNNVKKKFILDDYISQGDTTDLRAKLKEIEIDFDSYRQNIHLYKLKRAQKIAEDKKQAYYNIKIILLIARWYKDAGNTTLYVQTIFKLIKVLSAENKMKDGVWPLIDIGNLFFLEKDYGQATFFYDKAIEIAIKDSNFFAHAVAEMNHGLIAYKNKDLALAKYHFRQSANLKMGKDSEKYNCFSFIRLADAFIFSNEPDSAFYYIKKTKQLYDSDGIGDGLLIEIPGLINLTSFNYYRLINDTASANRCLKEAKEYFLQKNLVSQYLSAIHHEAKIEFDNSNYKHVVDLIKPALPLIDGRTINYLTSKYYHLYAQALCKTGDYNGAEKYFERIIFIEDSLKTSKSLFQLNQMRSIIDLIERDALLDIAEKEILIKQEKEKASRSERNLFIALSGLGLFTIIVLFYFFNRLANKKTKVTQLLEELEVQNLVINEKAIKLEQSNNVKNKLFAIIAHDLRAPLNLMLGQVGILREKDSYNNPEELNQSLSKLEQTLKETVELFERLLQWSKLDKNEITNNPLPLNLESVIKQVVRTFEPVFFEKNIEYSLDLKVTSGFADANLTHTILRNLINNAIEAVDVNGKITIGTERYGENEIRVSVVDNGKGFSKDWITKFKAGIIVNTKSNHGLGLLLCKDLAKMNRGELIIDENRTTGASVSFTVKGLTNEQEEVSPKISIKGIPDISLYQLSPLLNFKVYQSTQILEVIRNVKFQKGDALELFIKEIERAVYLGNKILYASLISEIEKNGKEKNSLNN
jgi:signal transduction histidine kinase